jgi:hypothetical protein
MAVTVYPQPVPAAGFAPSFLLASSKYIVTAGAVGGAQSAAFTMQWDAVAETECEYWDSGGNVSCHWTTIGADEPVDVRVRLVAGPIFEAKVYPGGVATQSIVDGELRLVVPANNRLRVEVNGDRRTPVHLFVSRPEIEEPIGAAQFNPAAPVTSVAANQALTFPSGFIYLIAPGFALNDGCTLTIEGGAVVVFDTPDVTGVATAGAATTITDSTQSWTTNQFSVAGAWVRITAGTGAGQIREIVSNTSTQITVTPAWTTNPTAGSAFSVIGYRRAGFDITNLTAANTGVRIQGHGVLTSLADSSNAQQDIGFETQVKYCAIATDSALTPRNLRIEGPTFVRWPFYLQRAGAHYLRNVQYLNPWTFNSNAFNPGKQSFGDPRGTVVECFGYTGDDTCIVVQSGQVNEYYGTFAVAARANAFIIDYFGFPVNDSTQGRIVDCHAMQLGDADSGQEGVYPLMGAQCILACWVDQTNANAANGVFNVQVSNLKVWGPLYSRLWSLENRTYPFGGVTANNAAGQIFDMQFDGITCEYVPGQVSRIIGRDAVSTPHDLTFANITLGGTKLDAGNYQQFVEVNAFPYDLTWDAPGLVVETGTASATATAYCSLAFANAYHASYGNPSAWSSATVATREAAIREATMALDLRYGGRWVGYRYSTTQALDWPRDYAYDAAGELIASDVVPLRVQQATAAMALMHIQGVTLSPTTRTTGDIKSESLSSASGSSKSVTYAGTKPAETQLVEAERMLATAGLIGGSSSWGWMDL